MSGLAIECATEHAEVAVMDERGFTRSHVIEEIGHGHTRRLAPLIQRALDQAKLGAQQLAWVAADLGPGSFTGVRVGLATAEALALATGARLVGVTSLEALAGGDGLHRESLSVIRARDGLVVPLVGAGRRDLYAGYFRVTRTGETRVLAAPRVGPVAEAIEGARELLAVLKIDRVRFVGPGAARERDALEHAYPGSTFPEWRAEGLSAIDLAGVARPRALDGAGTPPPLYVRPAQAEERVRHQALARQPLALREFTNDHVAGALEIERRVFTDPWTAEFFRGELGHSMLYARVAELDGRLAGYSMAWLGSGVGHLGNLAVAPGFRRRGVARALVLDLLDQARRRDVDQITLEVRSSNFAAQWLYRAHGFRLAGLRRGYYRDNGEDALVLEWRAGA